jgi:hypothetical protein
MSDIVAPPEEWWLVGGLEPATNRDFSWDLVGIYNHYKWYIITGWWFQT